MWAATLHPLRASAGCLSRIHPLITISPCDGPVTKATSNLSHSHGISMNNTYAGGYLATCWWHTHTCKYRECVQLYIWELSDFEWIQMWSDYLQESKQTSIPSQYYQQQHQCVLLSYQGRSQVPWVCMETKHVFHWYMTEECVQKPGGPFPI